MLGNLEVSSTPLFATAAAFVAAGTLGAWALPRN